MPYPRYPVNAGSEGGYSCCPAKFTPETCPAGGKCESGCPYKTVDLLNDAVNLLNDALDNSDDTVVEIYPDAQNPYRR